MYALINNGVVQKYPYTIEQLFQDNPNTSFPEAPSAETLAAWGVFPVANTDAPIVDHTKTVELGVPVFDGAWKQNWIVQDATLEEIKKRTDLQILAVRKERNARLTACDWVVIKYLELNQNIPGAWEVYRQALRDVPQQAGFPWTVNWPTQPE